MTAVRVRQRSLAAAAALLAAGAVWATHHALTLSGMLSGKPVSYLAVIYAAMYALLLWQVALAYLDTPATVTSRRQSALDNLNVVGIIPTYNEDPAALEAGIRSMLDQARRPQTIVVVDDGTPDPGGYEPVRAWFLHRAEEVGVEALWLRRDNRGKRHAQAAAVLATPEADIYWTVDSDTVSDPHALEELLKPMSDPQTQSVAGIVMAANVRRSFLTRFTDLWFVAGQLTDRAALSMFRAVWVNSGPIAVYRAAVLRDNLESYLTETFMGRKVPFSDDSLLTLYAMLRGATVQQSTAFAFSLMPESVGHHGRQFLRWMRGSTIRSWWRMRYLPLTSYAYWAHLVRWVQVVVASIVFPYVVLTGPLQHPTWETLLWFAAVPMLISYAVTLRYMIVRRSDQSTVYQWGTWLLTPVAAVWAMTVLRALRWYGVWTCWRTGWGTRATVEVRLESSTV